MSKGPHSMPIRYEYEKGHTARLRYHQVWDRLDGSLVSCHETYSSALRKITKLNEEWRMTYHAKSSDTDDMSSSAQLRGALASIVADPDCCEGSKAIARAALANPGEREAWHLIETAPIDEPILAAVKVVNNKTSAEWWERHVIVVDSETGNVTHDTDAGWSAGDYTHWQPLSEPPATAIPLANALNPEKARA